MQNSSDKYIYKPTWWPYGSGSDWVRWSRCSADCLTIRTELNPCSSAHVNFPLNRLIFWDLFIVWLCLVFLNKKIYQKEKKKRTIFEDKVCLSYHIVFLVTKATQGLNPQFYKPTNCRTHIKFKKSLKSEEEEKKLLCLLCYVTAAETAKHQGCNHSLVLIGP